MSDRDAAAGRPPAGDAASRPPAGEAASWRPLAEDDFDDVVALAARCLAVDGGLPLAADPSFLRRRWVTPTTVAVRDDGGRLIAAGAVRDGSVFVGLVDPAARGRGIGAALLDWGLDRGPSMTVETEGLTPAAEKLFASRGLRQVFAEDVMRIDLEAPASVAAPPTAGGGRAARDFEPRWPAGVTLETWNDATAPRFYAVYEASFRERPGFPGWSAAEWIDAVVEEGFRPDWSVLASVPDIGDVGFVTAAIGWIDQVGVVPAARGRGIGAALVGEALTRMRADGQTHAWLNVGVDNPAGELYRRLGFAVKGRRARYRR
ncbi:MAG TPA: GNAT family N-acetyltransferase [Actinoplanes sp.]|nr:GNAT family N-acetyltransferase [Actinoplanes sp.]